MNFSLSQAFLSLRKFLRIPGTETTRQEGGRGWLPGAGPLTGQNTRLHTGTLRSQGR